MFLPVKELISENKGAFYNWKQIGRPKDENSIEYIEMKRCKRQLRNHEYKLNFYNNLMDKPDSKNIFRLIRKNKASSNETTAMVIKGDQNQDVPDQALLFSEISSFTGGEAFHDGPFRVTVLFVTLVLLVVTITFIMSSACSTSFPVQLFLMEGLTTCERANLRKQKGFL
jgi:hypothetical protein